jgi:hypothetical protein
MASKLKKDKRAAVELVEGILGRKLNHRERGRVKGFGGGAVALSGRIAQEVAAVEGIPAPPRRRSAC